MIHGQRLRRVSGQRGGCALIAGKAVIQQRTGCLEAFLARRRPQHNSDQPQAVALGAGGDTDARLAGGAGFQPRDAAVAFEQLVGVDELGRAAAQRVHPDRAVVPHLGVVQKHFAAHQGDIPRGGKVPCLVQPAGVDKVGIRHAELIRADVHHLRKSGFAAADILSHGHRGVVGAGNADGLEHVVQRHLLAGLEPDLTAAHVVSVLTDGDKIVKVYLARLEGLKRQQQCHDLGDGGNRAPGIGVFLIEHRAGVLVDQDGCRAGHVKVGVGRRDDARSGRGKPAQQRKHYQHQAEQQGHGTFFHGSTPPAEIALVLRYAALCGISIALLAGFYYNKSYISTIYKNKGIIHHAGNFLHLGLQGKPE